MVGPVYYLDYAATTPPAPAVTGKMIQVLESQWGNPSSLHGRGALAREVLEEAREEVAAWLACRPREIVFTSGGTEANHLAVWGTVLAAREGIGGTDRREILLSAVEHSSLSECADRLRRMGWTVRFLPVDAEGRVSPDVLRREVSGRTLLVSIQWVNHEVGTVQPVRELAHIAREAGALFHTDAVQAASAFDVDVSRTGVDLMSLSGHKIYGPQGTGVLYIRSGVSFRYPFGSGRQERGRRPGTENVAGIAGLAEAVRELKGVRDRVSAQLERTRERLWRALAGRLPQLVRFTPRTGIHPAILSVGVPGEDGDGLVVALNRAGLQVSSGAACRAGEGRPSPVLLAMGISEDLAKSMIRISLGKGFSEEAVEDVAERFAAALRKVGA
ncbi:MAG: cysteine desulfurase family protein [Alicyclobacillaceae bacterium]|nr:cysteine desulfurase family protein [Alicyclobacillaceae bacterium]